MESADGDEHDGAHESAENVLDDNSKQIRGSGAACWEGHDHDLREDSGRQPADECPAPDSDRLVFLAPHARVVSKHDFERKVDQNSERQIFLTEALVQQFEVGDSVVGLESDLSDQVDDDEDLDVAELQDSTHDLVDVEDAVLLLRTVFALQECQS
jgi:hypothetical protein